MSDPISISRKADALRDQIAAMLLATGSATVAASDIHISLSEWRRIARAAARQIRRPVETIATDSRAWASLRDWPSTPEEEAKLKTALKDAMSFLRLTSFRGTTDSGTVRP